MKYYHWQPINNGYGYALLPVGETYDFVSFFHKEIVTVTYNYNDYTPFKSKQCSYILGFNQKLDFDMGERYLDGDTIEEKLICFRSMIEQLLINNGFKHQILTNQQVNFL